MSPKMQPAAGGSVPTPRSMAGLTMPKERRVTRAQFAVELRIIYRIQRLLPPAVDALQGIR